MSTKENTILGLKLPTDPRWVNIVAMDLQAILTDHAYCEMKAASQCISLIQLYPDKESLVKSLSEVVAEEWGHFRMVMKELEKRKLPLGKQRKDLYVNALIQHCPKGGAATTRLLHHLLLCALIEARSCERFRLLSLELEDDYLKKFYHKFMVSEAGHYRLFIDLACQYVAKEKVRAAWTEWLHFEAELLSGWTISEPTMH